MRNLNLKAIVLSIAVAATSICSVYIPCNNTCINVNAETSADFSISSNGLNKLCSLEGFHSTCYSDYSQSSIGYGTKCTGSSVQPHQSGLHTISKEDAMNAMKSQINSTYAPRVRNQTQGLTMNQSQFDALVSLCYNTGGGNTIISNSPLVDYLRGILDESQARSEYAGYYVRANGNVLQGLINRRNAEAELFFSESYGPVPKPTGENNIAEGRYHIVNAATGFYANHAYMWNEKKDYYPLLSMEKDGSPEQEFYISCEGNGKYRIKSGYDSNVSWNVWAADESDIELGCDITCYPYCNDNTQKFYFTSVGNNEYIIQSAQNYNYVFGTRLSYGYDLVNLQRYNPNNRGQIWKLVPIDVPIPTTTTASSTTTTTTTTTTEITTTTTTITTKPLELTESSKTIAVGEKYEIKANQNNLTYMSSDEDIAIVSKSGVISGIANGSATITVINGDKDTAFFKVTVRERVSGDSNCDDEVNMSDAVLIMQSLANPSKYGLNGSSINHITGHGIINGDIDGNGLTNADALKIQNFLLGTIQNLD